MAKSSISLTAARLREVMHYDPETGQVRSAQRGRVSRPIKGYLHHKGYIYAEIDGRCYGVHQLAWLYMTGVFPFPEVDHINRKRADNRWLNLRLATGLQNGRNRSLNKNNSSGVNGVHWQKQSKRWIVQLGSKYYGCFKDKEEAIKLATAIDEQRKKVW